MTIIHVVMFQFKPDAEPSDIQEACHRMLALQTQCIHPTTQKPYIKSTSGGRNDSLEAAKTVHSHGFIVEFENDDDRKYYLEKDPAHREFVQWLKTIVEKVGVMDYESGVF